MALPANPPIPNLVEVDWTTLEVGDTVYFYSGYSGRWYPPGNITKIETNARGDTFIHVRMPVYPHFIGITKRRGDPGNMSRFFKVNPMPGMLEEKALVQKYRAAMDPRLGDYANVNKTVRQMLGINKSQIPSSYNAEGGRRKKTKRSRHRVRRNRTRRVK